MNPETIVKSFIKDYFHWNEESFSRMSQLDSSHKADLSSLGIDFPPQIEQITDTAQFLQISSQNASQRTRLFNEIEAEYKKIIRKYCRPSWSHLGASFGSDSSHHPDNEVILWVEGTDDKAIVKTRHTYNSGFVENFEFHLAYEKEGWYLKEIYYVTEKGRYKRL